MQSSLGIDYRTNSGRALIVNCSNGPELASRVVDYPSGHQGVPLDRNNHHLARQIPQIVSMVSKRASEGRSSWQQNRAFRPRRWLALDDRLEPDAGRRAEQAARSRSRLGKASQCSMLARKDHTNHHEAPLERALSALPQAARRPLAEWRQISTSPR
jgi:hypothetical protein